MTTALTDMMPLDPKQMLAAMMDAQQGTPEALTGDFGEPPDQSRGVDFDKIKRWHTQAKAAVTSRQLDWVRYLDYYEGNQWGGLLVNEDAEGKTLVALEDRVTINSIWVQVENIVPRITQANMTWVAKAVDQQSEVNQEACTKALKAKIEKHELAWLMEQAVRHSVLFGMGFWQVYFDDFRGDVAFDLVSPFAVYPDSTASSLEKCRYLFIRKEISEDDFVERFDFPLEVAERAGLTQDTTAEYQTRDAPDATNDMAELVQIWECFTDHGRHQIIFTGDTILWEGDNRSGGMTWPIIPFCGTSTGFKFWCNGEVSNMISLQDVQNSIATRINVNILNQVASAWLAEEGISIEKIDATPGAVNKVGKLDKMEPIQTPPMTSDVYNFLQIVKGEIQEVSGIRASMQGAREQGLTSGIAQSQVRESGEVRVNIILRRVQRAFREAGRRALRLLQQFSDRLVDNRLTLGGDVVDVGPQVYQGNFDVTVEQSGELGRSPMAVMEAGLRLFQLNAFSNPDAKYILEAIDWPGWRTWWAELQAKIKQQQEQQAAAQQQQQMAAQQQQQQQGQQQQPQAMFGAPPPDGASAYSRGF